MSRRILSISVFFCLGSIYSAQLTTSTETPAERAASFFWGDFDRDELADAFVIAPSGEGRLLRNPGDGTLEDVTEEAGLAGAKHARFALWEDFDRDQDLDLFVGTVVGSRLFANQGHAAFLDVTEIAGLARSGPALNAGFLDYDQDGLPDLHLRTADENLLYRNLGNALFQRMDLGLEPSPVGAESDSTAVPDSLPGSPLATPPSPGSSGALGKDTLARTGEAPAALDAPLDVSLSGRTESLLPPPGSLDAIAFPACALALKDQDGTGCLKANSIPTLGMLYPINSNFFVDIAGRVGLGTTSPVDRLHVVGGGLFTGSVFNDSAVEGDNPLTAPTNGYLGVNGVNDFDGIASADWVGLDIGVAGISTGGSTGDNYGIIGHSNGVAIRGELATNPTGTFAELGTSSGVGVRADGSTLAGEFLGNVDVRGGLDVENGLLEVFDSTAQKTFEVNPENAGGASLTMFNETNTGTFVVDSDTGTGDARIQMKNGAGLQTVEIDSGTTDNGGEILLENSAGSVAIELDAQSGPGGVINLFNDAGLNTFHLDGDLSGGAFLSITDGDGDSSISMFAGFVPGTSLSLDAAGGNTTLLFDGESTNSGGLVSVRNDAGSGTVELIGDTGYGNSGAISLFDRTNGANSVIIRGRDSLGTGGQIEMTGTSGGLTVNIDGDLTGGGLQFREDDGSVMCDLFQTLYTFNDSAGATTISFNRSTGTKSAVVDTENYGRRLLYTMESPEVWFEDFGSARLQAGVAVVRLDPMFLETVTIDETDPMKVFVELNGPSTGVWIEKGSDRFIVHEQAGGTGDAAFDWRVVAKRKGLESLRLRAFDDELAAEAALGGDPSAASER